MDDLDWNRLRAFLATADAGSLSAAARRIGLSQPTLSRQVAALEEDLGVTLFERVGKRLVLTETAQSLMQQARAMGDAAQAMRLAAAGRAEDVTGLVRISASDAYAVHVLPDLLPRLRRDAPQITISILADNAPSDLRRREADIAIRHGRPREDGLIGRLIRDCEAGFYATPDWLAAHPGLGAPTDLPPDQLLAFEEVADFTAHLIGMGLSLDATALRLCSANSAVVWQMALRGLGVAVMLDDVAARSPGMVRLFPDLAGPRFPLWLVTHRELRTSRRIRLVYDILAEQLSRPPQPAKLSGTAALRRAT